MILEARKVSGHDIFNVITGVVELSVSQGLIAGESALVILRKPENLEVQDLEDEDECTSSERCNKVPFLLLFQLNKSPSTAKDNSLPSLSERTFFVQLGSI